MGHWIHDALLVRWVDLTVRLSDYGLTRETVLGFGPECPEAKEILHRCLLDSDSVCMDRHACDDEYDSFVALGRQGMPK